MSFTSKLWNKAQNRRAVKVQRIQQTFQIRMSTVPKDQVPNYQDKGIVVELDQK